MSVSTSIPAPVPAARKPAGRADGQRRRRGPSAYVILGGLIVLAILMLLPFVLVALNAVKTPSDFAAHGPVSLPSSVSFAGIANFWSLVDFTRLLWNSLLISTCVAVAAVVLSVLNAYALGIGRVKGRNWILAIFLLANFLPQESLVYPLYYVAKQVGLYDTQLSVIIILTVIQAAFGTYLLSSVLATFPRAAPGGRADRRGRPLAGAVAGSGPDQPADHARDADPVLPVDLE